MIVKSLYRKQDYFLSEYDFILVKNSKFTPVIPETYSKVRFLDTTVNFLILGSMF